MSEMPPPLDAEVTFHGGLKGSIEAGASLGPKPPECFVAMWFGSDGESEAQMDQLLDLVIAPAIRKHGLEPYHVGRDHGADRLDVEILSAIDRSVLVVVDLTHNPKEGGLRGSVIFEAGYAYKTKPVVWMCREDVAEQLPFDVRQFRQVRWNPNRIERARTELASVIGDRFRGLQTKRSNHEITRRIAKAWDQMRREKDWVSKEGKIVWSIHRRRSDTFGELCDDIFTRAKYKPMGLSADERYELIELVRQLKSSIEVIDDGLGDSALTLNSFILPSLIASGWIAGSTPEIPED